MEKKKKKKNGIHKWELNPVAGQESAGFLCKLSALQIADLILEDLNKQPDTKLYIDFDRCLAFIDLQTTQIAIVIPHVLE